MINGIKSGVKLFIDAGLKDCKLIYAHPLVNDRTLSITPTELLKFLAEIECDFQWIEMD